MAIFMERLSENGIFKLIFQGLCPLRKSTGEELIQGPGTDLEPRQYGLRIRIPSGSWSIERRVCNSSPEKS